MARDNPPEHLPPPDLDFSGSLMSAEQKTTDYYDQPMQAQVRYETMEGIFGAPTAGVSTPVLPMRLHSPMTLKIVEFTAQRIGLKPRIPAYNNTNPNETLLYRTIIPWVPKLMRNERDYVYKVTVKYIYLLSYTPTEADYLYVGTTPDTITPPESHAIEPQQFDPNLFRSTPPGNFNAGQLGDLLSG